MLRKRTIGLILLLLAVSVLGAACSQQEPQETVSTEPTYQDFGDMEETIPETVPPVQVQMPDYELTYSGEFKDLIHVTELTEESALLFTVQLSQAEAELFKMLYNSDDGDLVMVMEDASGNRIPVAFQMKELPDNLSAEDQDLFLTAQEEVNEIVASLKLK